MEKTKNACRYYIRNVTVVVHGQKHSFQKFIVYADETNDWMPGYTLCFSGTLEGFLTASNPGEFDSRAYYRQQNIYYQLYGDTVQVLSTQVSLLEWLPYKVRKQLESVINQALPKKQEGIVKAMLLGNRSELSEETRTLYQVSGISHLLAISGVCTLSLVSLRPP